MTTKQQIFEQLLAQRGIRVAHQHSIPPQAQQDYYDLSPGQERLWVLHEIVTDAAAYNMFVAKRIQGALQYPALYRSVQEIVHRHASLRTAFVMQQGSPRQFILPELSINLPMIDLQAIPEEQRQREVDRYAKETALVSFNLAHPPLFQTCLLQLHAQEYMFLLVMHHIIGDGWSLDIFFQELATLYTCLVTHTPISLAKLPIQYHDYAHWQRQQLHGDTVEQQRTYWVNQLHDAIPFVALPTDHPRTEEATGQGASLTFIISAQLTHALKELGKREEATLFMVLLTAYAVLLSSYSHQDDILITTPIANRPHAELHHLIGLFMSTLVLRVQLKDLPTYQIVLQQVRTMCLEAYAHQDIPIEQVLEILRPQRDIARTSLLQFGFALQNIPRNAPQQFAQLSMINAEGISEIAKLELSFTLWENKDTLMGLVEYNRDLFEQCTIERMANHYCTILERIVVDVTRPITTLVPILATNYVSQETITEVYARSNLTRPQLMFWIGQQLQPDLPMYNVPAICFIQGPMEARYFEQAFTTLVQSSDALRTIFVEVDGIPVQQVLDTMDYQIEYIDFTHVPDPRVAFREWAQVYSQRVLRLDTCLFEVAFATLGPQEFGFYFNLHHLITDSWSHALIGRYLIECYGLALEQKLPITIEIPAFQNQVVYEHKHQTSQRTLRAQAYWHHKLAEQLEPITFYGKAAVKQTTKFHPISYELGKERTQKLLKLAHQFDTGITHNASLFQILAAAVYVYLYRISGNQRLVLHVPFHNRRTKTAKDTIGLFMETLPVHVVIEPDETFVSLLDKVTQDVTETMRHNYYTVTNPRHQSAYDVVLNFRVVAQIDFGTNVATIEAIEPIHAEYSLLVQPHDYLGSGNMVVDFGFHHDIFDPDMRTRAVTHFITILDAFLDNPTQPISQASIVATEERRLLIEAGNQATAPVSADTTLIDLFETQMFLTPDRIAVSDQHLSLTYEQLEHSANQLAHYLQHQGVRAESYVGICLDRSCTLVVALLAVLKAGGAYVPLDPTYPTERLVWVCTDAQPQVIITQQSWVAPLSSSTVTLICLDTLDSVLTAQSKHPPQRLIHSTNAAYMIYTSGSTGRPKGTIIDHTALVQITQAWKEAYGLGTTYQAHLQMASSAFDVFTGDVARALTTGDHLVICPTDLLLAPADLAAFITQRQISVAEFVPVVLRSLMEYLHHQKQLLPRMRLLIIGSDRWYGREHSGLHQLCGDHTSLVHSYGVTEATIDSSYFATTVQATLADTLTPIGRPFPHTHFSILNDQLQLVPIGVAGELYISGTGLARGYHGRPALTAARFLPNPFSALPGLRMYQTGDQARYHSNGYFELLGRTDQQVKLRGYRIETGEIEAMLCEQHGVDAALVTLRQDLDIDPQLVAYIVTDTTQAVNEHSLRNRLQKHLPQYMIPQAFVCLPQFPLTPNGKIDRGALPRPTIDSSKYEYVAPQTQTEVYVARIWADILQVDQVGRNDNFFELGGYSLLITQVITRVRDTFQINLPLRCLFEAQTVASFAQMIDEVDPSQGTPPMAPSATTAEQLWSDTTLESSISGTHIFTGYPKHPQAVFITGATGFLGAFLVAELLEQTQAQLYCLVRTTDTTAGLHKIIDNLTRYHVWQAQYATRIHPLVGNLALPLLGLSQAQFNHIAQTVDCIYHNGAVVHFTQPYAAMKLANVTGTQEILRLAGQGKVAPVHLVSTISVFSGEPYTTQSTIYEDDALAYPPIKGNGYTQSKWVAEKIAMTARTRGIPITIYRPGRITGHSQSGLWNTTDLLCQILKGWIMLGSAPAMDMPIPMVPVDYVSRALVHLSQQEECLGQTFHLINPTAIPLHDIISCMNQRGFSIIQRPYADWQQQLTTASKATPSDALATLQTFFPERLQHSQTKQLTESAVAHRGPTFDHQSTVQGLTHTTIRCPPTDKALINRYLTFLDQQGFFAPSPVEPANKRSEDGHNLGS